MYQYFIILFVMLKSVMATGFILEISQAEKWFKINDEFETSPSKKQEFVLGLLFESFNQRLERYAALSLDQKINLTEIALEKNSFESGRLFHRYILNTKYKCYHQWKIPERLNTMSKHSLISFLGFFEDECYYDRSVSILAFGYLSSLTIGELSTGYSIENLAVDHGIMCKYFSDRPSISLDNLRQEELEKLNIPIDEVGRWKKALSQYLADSHFKNYVYDLKDVFDQQFEIYRLRKSVKF